MPGFGNGPFGHMAFGEWWWSHYVLFDLIPSLYRERDADGFLEKFAQSLRPSFDQLRRKMRDFGELRDPLLVRAAATETQTFRLGKQVVLKGPIEQSGVDGKVVVYGEFTAKTARFTDADRGKELTIVRSSKPENNTSVTVVSIVDQQTVAVLPRLSLDAGPMRWNLRQTYIDPPNQTTIEIRGGGVELGKVAGGWLLNDGFASFEIRDRKLFPVPADERSLLTERDGTKNGTIDSQGRLSTPTYQFAFSDVGKVIFLADSVLVENNGRFEILGVDKLSPTDFRAVFSRLDVSGRVPLTTQHDSAGTVRYANKPGKIARIQHVQAGFSTPLSVSVSGSDITVNLATDPSGFVFTTASALVAAVNADIYASALLTASVPGTGTGYVSATTGLLDVPGITLQSDSDLTWSLTPFGRVVLRGPTPTGLVTADGIDGQLQVAGATQATLKATTSSPFRPGDIGRHIVLRGSLAGNDGVYVVGDVPAWGAGSVVTLFGLFTNEPTNHLVYWEIRTDSGYTDFLTTVASAPSMLSELAKDFGIEVDTQESEARQRSWVKYVNEWIDKKGLAKAYEILASISGYSSSVFQLYNISFGISQQLPSLQVFEITDTFGQDGVFADALGAQVTLNSDEALFSIIDVGRYLRTQLAASGNNNQLFEIIDFYSPTSIRLQALGPLPTAPDLNNGAIHWAVLRLYTNIAPARPNFDDFDSDQMNALIPGFTVDSYCSEQPIKIGVGGAGGALSVVATAQQVDSSFVFLDGDITVVEALGNWALTDALDRVAFLEAVPVPVLSLSIGAGNSTVSYFSFDPTYPLPIRVRHVNPGPLNPDTTVSVVFGPTTDITVTLRTDGGGAVLATAQEVVLVVETDPFAAGLVVASVNPGNGTGLAATSGFVTLASNGIYRTLIGSAVPLALGAAGLEYICEQRPSCDYCISYRVLLELELDTLFNEDNNAFERVFERTMERLKDVTPAHVELVPRLIQPLTATLNLTATIEPVEILATLYAPLSLRFEETPVDAELDGTGDTIGGVAPTMTLFDAAGLFQSGHVGQYITISGATTPANNGVFLVTGFTDEMNITYTNPTGVAEAFPGTWGFVMYTIDTSLSASITTP